MIGRAVSRRVPSVALRAGLLASSASRQATVRPHSSSAPALLLASHTRRTFTAGTPPRFSAAAAAEPAKPVSALVIGESDPATGQVSGATLSAITAAKQLGGKVTVLINGESAAEHCAKLDGVNTVATWKPSSSSKLDLAHGAAEHLSPIVRLALAQFGATHLVASATTVGKGVLPRVAAHLDSQPISEITKVIDHETFVRPIYAGNALATVKSSDKVKALTVRATAFEKAAETSDSKAEIVEVNASADAGVAVDSPEAVNNFVSEQESTSDRPDLSAAGVVISGGRGLKSGENFKILYDLADKLGAAVGASRAAVDAGFVANELQIGQTGKIVAPQLYVAVGISGAIQHLAGMKDSKIIVAINKDEDAPIFQVADYGLVADLFEAVPEMTKKL